MFTPAHVRQTMDMSEFYIKPPHEMSRYEIQEVERLLKLEQEEDQKADAAPEDDYDEEGNLIDKLAIYKQTEEYQTTLAQIRKLQPMRIAYFKRFWDKFKYNKARREYLIEQMDKTSEQVAYYLGDEYKDWRDEIPGAREFLKQIETKTLT